MYVSFGSKVRPRTFGCIAMGCVFFRSILVVYSAGSGVNRLQVVLSEFSMALFCFVQAKPLCRYGCIHLLAALVLFVCGCDGDVICVGHDLNRCTGLW